MKTIAYVVLIVGGISLIMGIISRLTLTPVGAGRIEAQAFLAFANTCFLAAITFILLQMLKNKQ